MKAHNSIPPFLFTLLLAFSLQGALRAQFVQQGNKLIGSGASGHAGQGWSVALSGDGATAIVGGPSDNNLAGAAWIFTRSGNTWTQQGNKLVGTTASGPAQQGSSVAISADGNTAIVGGFYDDNYGGAVWVFTRDSGIWSQQGIKLVGTGTAGPAEQGYSVSLSADGNTALVGGFYDSTGIGAAWVFTRSGGVWSQQGNKLVGGDVVGIPHQGLSVALSADGNTALIGGLNDSSHAGAAWVFTRSGGVWAQQGNKLVGSGSVYAAEQGSSLALSSDGNTAIIGGYFDNSGLGAAWVFSRNGTTWHQEGTKLVGADAVGVAYLGTSVSLSSDGNTAIVSGFNDNYGAGATWVFKRSYGIWTQIGTKLVGTGAVNGADGAFQGRSISLSADGSTIIAGGNADSGAYGAVWVFIDTTTSAVRDQPVVQFDYHLSENYPNPFNPETKISFSIPKEQYVSLVIYDLLGREVTRLIQENKLRGGYSVVWNAACVPSGVYYYRLVAGYFVETKKMIVIK